MCKISDLPLFSLTFVAILNLLVKESSSQSRDVILTVLNNGVDPTRKRDGDSRIAELANLEDPTRKHPWHLGLFDWNHRSSYGPGPERAFKPGKIKLSYTDKYVGSVILLFNGDYLIKPNIYLENEEDNSVPEFTLPTPNVFSSDLGLKFQHTGPRIKYEYMSRFEGWPVFHVYKRIRHKYVKLDVDTPELWTDISDPPSDCVAYTWTHGINFNETRNDKAYVQREKEKFTYGHDLVEPELDVKFYSVVDVQMSCEKNDNNEWQCQGKSKTASLCDSPPGMPVLCGPRRKLAYVSHYYSRAPPSKGHCSFKFGAAFLPPVFQKIKESDSFNPDWEIKNRDPIYPSKRKKA